MAVLPTNSKNADYQALQPAYVSVTLTNLDESGYLVGEWANIRNEVGDYWAVTVSNIIAPTPDPACVADWDSVSYTSSLPHCLRRVDLDLHYPQDLLGLVHHDGQIWSRALWDIRQSLGHEVADALILEAQFDFAPDSSMPAAAQVTVATAERLYGKGVAQKVEAAFIRSRHPALIERAAAISIISERIKAKL